MATFAGEGEDHHAARDVVGLGDLDGDGRAEFATSAYSLGTPEAEYAGALYLLSWSPPPQ